MSDAINDEIQALCEIDDRFEALIEELKPAVELISQNFPTSQNHFDDWVDIISETMYGNEARAKIAACALIGAGANRQGVLDAYKTLIGKDLVDSV